MIQDPSVCFTNDAILLVKQYCPEALNKVIAKTDSAVMRTEKTTLIARTPWTPYLKSATYQWKNIFGVLQYQLSLTIDWGTDGNNEIAYCGVSSRLYKDNPGMSLFMTWSSGNYINK